MSSILWKNFYLCFSRIRCPQSEPLEKENSRRSLLIKNFNSIYDLSSDSAASKPLTPSTTAEDFLCSSSSSSSSSTFSSSSDYEASLPPPPDFAAVCASNRFFFSSPGRSNSILSAPPERPKPADPAEPDVLVDGVPVATFSPDPYSDFRQSMQEMVEAHHPADATADWDYLQDLLFCYLTLNPRQTHKFIFGAFADLLVCLNSQTAADVRRRRR